MRGWGDRRRSYAHVTELFNQTFKNEDNDISKSAVIRTVQRFEETGFVKDRNRQDRPAIATNPDKRLNVLQSFIEDPRNSIRKVAQQHDIDPMSIHKILNKEKFHPYKIHLAQELYKAIFELTGNINQHYCRYWSDENPHWMYEAHTQNQQKVNVWAGILNEAIIGPFFIEGNLNTDNYLAMLQDEIVSAIRNIARQNFNDIWFQQDGAPPHYGLRAVTARIAKIKLKVEPVLHLLDACKLLRTERDKERNLISQKEQEEETISDLQNSLQRVERELYTLKRNSIVLTSQILIQHLTEEVTVQSAIVKEKLPSELNAKKNRIQALSLFKEYSYLGADKIMTMRNNLDAISKAIQDLIESKITKNDIDKVGPFRQQAAAVGNMKRNALERLEKIESYLEELQSRLKEKQDYSKTLLETSIPRAEELKKYINRLKTKSTLYKRCKAERAGLKAESGVLQRTVTILDEQIIHSYSVNIIPKVIIPENYTLDNALATNTQLSHSILALRTNLAPVIKGNITRNSDKANESQMLM
ncbi:uncharacterized protein [Mycetomoellerius zeteki]|uniref:uncharacterized protein n=1 Tax=Mycetomoellerius zeteki TaxID=64791 RepID=UPI00084ECD3D|nr:PREDICTED: uncharacterized protein LOC108730380 [Trachymyrmex zeteki]